MQTGSKLLINIFGQIAVVINLYGFEFRLLLRVIKHCCHTFFHFLGGRCNTSCHREWWTAVFSCSSSRVFQETISRISFQVFKLFLEWTKQTLSGFLSFPCYLVLCRNTQSSSVCTCRFLLSFLLTIIIIALLQLPSLQKRYWSKIWSP